MYLTRCNNVQGAFVLVERPEKLKVTLNGEGGEVNSDFC